MVRSTSSSRLSATIGLLVAFFWPLLQLIPGVSTHNLSNPRDLAATVCFEWLVVFVLALIAFRIQDRRPSDFGLRWPGWRDILASLAALVIAFILSGIASRFVHIPSSLNQAQKMAVVPLALRFAVVLTAGICEEFIYRGFAIEELASFTRGRWLAALIALLFFTVPHARIYGLSPALLIPGLIGAVLTVLYLSRRNLTACMLMHALMDGTFLILLPALSHAK